MKKYINDITCDFILMEKYNYALLSKCYGCKIKYFANNESDMRAQNHDKIILSSYNTYFR